VPQVHIVLSLIIKNNIDIIDIIVNNTKLCILFIGGGMFCNLSFYSGLCETEGVPSYSNTKEAM
jgi:hypothetical protein